MTAVPLSKLASWNPFENIVWAGLVGNFVGQGNTPIKIEEVRLAIEEERLRKLPVGPDGTRKEHVERVAYLVVHRDPTPIEIDVGIPHLNYHVDWPILDGHHRLAAAFYRGDETIEADVAGDLDYGEKLLGIKLPGNLELS